MSETKPVLHATRRHNYLEMPESVARPSGDKTFRKFGEDVDIQDFINAGIEQTSIMKHIEDAGGLQNLKAAGATSIDDEVIDRGMDFVTMNRIAKIGNIAMKKIEEKRIAEEKAKQEQEQKDKGE